ncbi:SDR family oxidoreductase [Promethearchaeum syntrophicum]|uniref:SDR family oxidoreductase n=1 Tax=Promethearchaeum syntrophicum TaxID=2594042 RepID=A0A5B9D5G1_9ARCH|nr:SDR family oxidoreductase [Candidatus Prometheoarchaeum syntrophicum]QEE14348.1 short chain dehydrogenase [Candidatus Prometheoarchaeum syntrophicum]
MVKLDLTGKICLITGGNAGIGKETAKGIAKLGATVILACRNLEKGKRAMQEISQFSGNSNIDIFECNLSQPESIRKFVSKFTDKYSQLHILINNAAGFFYKRQETKEGYELTFATNYLGPFLLTNLLLDTMKVSSPARIINVSSNGQMMAKLTEKNIMLKKGYSSIKAYGNSKLALTMFTYELAHRLNGTGIDVNAVHPGEIKTGFGVSNAPWYFKPMHALGSLFKKTPEKGAITSIYLASSPEVEGVTGKYFIKCQPKRSTKKSYNIEWHHKIWAIGKKLTGLQ